MKIKGFKMTYYMKNGCELVDESYKFKEPREESDEELLKACYIVTKSVKDAVSSEDNGYIAYGNLYVNIREINAIRFELIKAEV